MKKKLTAAVITLLLFTYACSNEIVNPPVAVSPGTSTFTNQNAMEWMKLSIDIVVLENIPAPTCSRLYGYCGIAIYESVYRGIPGHRSLAGQLRDMPQMPSPENEVYDWPSVMAAALKIVCSNILYLPANPNSPAFTWINDLYDSQIAARRTDVGDDIVNRSILFGEAIGNQINDWSNSDNFLATRDLEYIPPPRSENPAFWEPTLPGQHALEPYLGTQKPFCMVTQNQCQVPLEFPFDTIPGSTFYNEGMEVLLKSQNLTQEEMDIAFFWEDKAGTGQPPGHWVSITNIMVEQFNLKLDEAAKLYALIGSGIRDSFISCWEAKYRVNLLRPKTYIRDYLGEPFWNTIVVTPPFPEYTSGHSVVSGCSAEILTEWFGDNISFVDDTHNNEPGLRNRTFTSFYHAADEAAISRLYGGIHYRAAIENGIEQGHIVASVVMNTIHFK